MAHFEHLDFLDSEAFEPGEFEATQLRLDQLLAGLRKLLFGPVREAICSDLKSMAQQVEPGVGLSGACSICVGDQGPSKKECGTARTCVRLDPSDVDAQAVTSAQELSHLALSCWLAPLTSMPAPAGGLTLNREMLPGPLITEQVLQSLPIESYGVSMPDVIEALRQFRENLVLEAGIRPIELGPRLTIVYDSTETNWPFRLFHSDSRYVATSSSKNAWL